ncbi:MAG: hypothetical protein ACRDNO_24010 [Trebonia sp.]
MATAAYSALLADYSLDMTGKLGELEPTRALIPPGVVTQFGFDPGRSWRGVRARARGISLPVRVGVPGPVNVRLLLSCASGAVSP